MDKRLDKLENKMDQVVVDIAEIKSDLKEHMRRSLANEENNKLLREYIDTVKSGQEEKNKKYDVYVDRIKFVGLIISGIFAVIGTLAKIGLIHF